MGDFPLKAACSPVDPPASELASLNQGEPLVLSDPRSAVTLSMLQLVKRVAPQVAPVDTRPSGIFRRR